LQEHLPEREGNVDLNAMKSLVCGTRQSRSFTVRREPLSGDRAGAAALADRIFKFYQCMDEAVKSTIKYNYV
jgi:hypothetical protein